MGNKEMSEKTQKNFFFLFLFPFTPNFSFYLKYDRNFVLLIFRKKEEKAATRIISRITAAITKNSASEFVASVIYSSSSSFLLLLESLAAENNIKRPKVTEEPTITPNIKPHIFFSPFLFSAKFFLPLCRH